MDTQRRPPSLSTHGTNLPDFVNRKFLRGLSSKALGKRISLEGARRPVLGSDSHVRNILSRVIRGAISPSGCYVYPSTVPPIPGAAGRFIIQMISNGVPGVTECMRWKSKNTGSKIAVCCDLRRRWVKISEQWLKLVKSFHIPSRSPLCLFLSFETQSSACSSSFMLTRSGHRLWKRGFHCVDFRWIERVLVDRIGPVVLIQNTARLRHRACGGRSREFQSKPVRFRGDRWMRCEPRRDWRSLVCKRGRRDPGGARGWIVDFSRLRHFLASTLAVCLSKPCRRILAFVDTRFCSRTG